MAEEDLIFGKNRHLFGGIEPSNMLNFTAVLDKSSGTAKIKIEAQLPNDTVINRQTLCTVAGAVIRRKLTNYPIDEFDGDMVASIKTSSTIYDANINENVTYYYAAFPFTAQGVYNRNTANRVVVNEPHNMVAFSSESVNNDATGIANVEITANLPTGVVGAVIRRSTRGYPINETDGEAFNTITSDGVYTDSSVVIGTTYYYSAFTYTSTGAYNRNPANRTSCIPTRYQYLFGFDLNMNDSNPETRITYPADVDNASFAAAKMNFANNMFSYGGWPNSAGKKFMPKPCMLTYGGVVDHYLNSNDYTKKVDGTPSSISDTSFGGNAMIEWPKIFTKRWTEGGTYKFRCCNIQLDSSYECWCNYDRNNNQINHFYTPIFFGSVISGKMRSISGLSRTSFSDDRGGDTAAREIAQAKANGADWYTEVLADRLLINDLLIMMAKTTECQTAYGSGLNSGKGAIGTGTMNTKGMFWGDDAGVSGVKVFGMENWWGNYYRRIAGWIVENGTQKVKITRGTKDGSTATDYNTTGSGYKTISGATPAGTSGGYISSMKNENFGRLPVVASGSATTFESDILRFGATGVFYAYVCCNYYMSNYSTELGPFFSDLTYTSSQSGSSFGTALSCKPLA